MTDLDNIVLQHNCTDGFPMIPDGHFNTTVTSPPYYAKRKYCDGEIGQERTPEEYIEKLLHVFREVRRVTRDDGTLWLNIGDSYWGGKGKSGAMGADKGAKRYDAGRALTHKWQNTGGIGEIRPTDYTHKIIKRKDLIGIPWRLAFALRDDGVDLKTCNAIQNAIGRLTQAFDGAVIPTKVEHVIEDLRREYALAKGKGWYLRSDIIWAKPNGMIESVRDRCTVSHEYIFMLSKSRFYHYDQQAILTPAAESTIKRLSQDVDLQAGSMRVPGKDPTRKGIPVLSENYALNGRGLRGHSGMLNDKGEPIGTPGYANKKTVWRVAPKPTDVEHFATYPDTLIEPCILAGSPEDGRVFDPFFGTGTTGRVAKRHHRIYTGIELYNKYIGIARKEFVKEFGVFFNERW